LFDIGGSLARAREGQRLSLADAERLTCLRGKYLVALEDERFDALPGRVYARAFLRTYASALGLEAQRFVEEFDSRFPEASDDVVVPTRRRRPRPSLGAVFVATATAAIVAVVVWSTLSDSPRPAPVPRAVAAPRPHPHAAPAVAAPAITPPRHVPLVIHAARGRCWLLVRRGGANGPVMYEGVLDQGQTIRFAARVWVRLGAPWNVTARRGSRVVGRGARTPINLVA
jgi:hypothetical protein